jgi:hypothetical protein
MFHIVMDMFDIMISMVNNLLYVIIITLICGIKMTWKLPNILTVFSIYFFSLCRLEFDFLSIFSVLIGLQPCTALVAAARPTEVGEGVRLAISWHRTRCQTGTLAYPGKGLLSLAKMASASVPS